MMRAALVMAGLASTMMLGAASARAATFDYTETFTNTTSSTATDSDGALTVTGSGTFQGDLNGNIISELSDPTLKVNGMAAAGPFYVDSYNYQTMMFMPGGATATLDGTDNNFLFINANFPTVQTFNALFYSVGNVPVLGSSATQDAVDYSLDSVNAIGLALSPNSALTITQVAAAPEPSTWLLMFAGIGGIGLTLRRAKKTMGFRFTDGFSA